MAAALGDRVVLEAPVHRVDHGDDCRRRGWRARDHTSSDRASATGGHRGATHIGRPHRLSPRPPRAARPVDPAHAGGGRHQMPGRLRPSLLARRRAQRAGRDQPTAREDHLRQLTALGRSGCAPRVRGGPLGRRARCGSRRTSCARRCSRRSSDTSVSRARRVEDFVAQDWQKEPWTRGLLRRPPPAGGMDAVRPRTPASRSVRSIGPAPRPRWCGPATWTVRSSPASGPRARCNSRSEV